VVGVRRQVQRQREQADHHALVGLGRMARDRHRMVDIDVAVHVGDLQIGLEDGRLDGHGGDA
jgi:hypothetical protein